MSLKNTRKWNTFEGECSGCGKEITIAMVEKHASRTVRVRCKEPKGCGTITEIPRKSTLSLDMARSEDSEIDDVDSGSVIDQYV